MGKVKRTTLRERRGGGRAEVERTSRRGGLCPYACMMTATSACSEPWRAGSVRMHAPPRASTRRTMTAREVHQAACADAGLTPAAHAWSMHS